MRTRFIEWNRLHYKGFNHWSTSHKPQRRKNLQIGISLVGTTSKLHLKTKRKVLTYVFENFYHAAVFNYHSLYTGKYRNDNSTFFSDTRYSTSSKPSPIRQTPQWIKFRKLCKITDLFFAKVHLEMGGPDIKPRRSDGRKDLY